MRPMHAAPNADPRRAGVGPLKPVTLLQTGLGFLRPHRAYFIQLGCLLLSVAVLNLLQPIAAKALMDDGALARDHRLIWTIVAIQACLHLGVTLLLVARGQTTMHLVSRLSAQMNAFFLQRLLRVPASYFDGKGAGQVVERLREFERVQRFACIDLFDITTMALFIVTMLPIVWFIDPFICLIFIVSLSMYGIWIGVFRRLRRPLDAARFEAQAHCRSHELGMFEGIADIKLAGREDAARVRWEAVQHDLLRTSFRAGAIDQMQNVGGRLISGAALTGVALYAAVGVAEGRLTPGSMVVAMTLALQLYVHLDALLDLSRRMQDAELSLGRMREVTELRSEHDGYADRLPLADQTGPLRVEGLGFSHAPGSPPVLKNISFDARPGATIAIVGPSGSGKTTLLKVLLKLHDAAPGQIFIGDEDLSCVPPSEWRARCGAVMQDGVIFDDTVVQNIVGAGPVDMGRVRRLAHATRCDQFIEGLPEGYDTLLGRSGRALSAGQRQRLLVARALYKAPKYLFLDEATSALDAESEAVITRVLREETPGATKVLVAHRLSTVRNADVILVMDDGRIAQRGTHRELLAQGGLYADLFFAAGGMEAGAAVLPGGAGALVGTA